MPLFGWFFKLYLHEEYFLPGELDLYYNTGVIKSAFWSLKESFGDWNSELAFLISNWFLSF